MREEGREGGREREREGGERAGVRSVPKKRAMLERRERDIKDSEREKR